MFLLGLIAFAALVVAIVAIAQGNILRSRIENLEKTHRAPEPPPAAPPPPAKLPPPLPKWLQEPAPPPVPPPITTPAPGPVPSINWESLVGVKLFAWIGGFAFFLGIVFFVKYAFDNNLITPLMRVIIGGLVGLALIGVGVLPALRRYRIPAQSLVATGILICYADIYCAHAFYGLISLSAASVLMWLVTTIALFLGERTGSPWILWLGLIGGFLTPILFRTGYQSAIALFGYVAALNCGIAAVSAMKRWQYFIFAAAVCTVLIEFTWATDFFQTTDEKTTRFVFLVFQALFLLISIAILRVNRNDKWSLIAAAVAGLAPLLAVSKILSAWDFGFLPILLATAGSIGLAGIHRDENDKSKILTTIIATALALACLAEWRWWSSVFHDMGNLGDLMVTNDTPLLVDGRMETVATWLVAIFILFALTPYVCGQRRKWPWIIAAAAGPAFFPLIHHCLTDFLQLSGTPVIPHQWKWLVPVGFSIPAVVGILYLLRRGVEIASGDSRLASQGAAAITFLSLIFPVQFHREWITLGWAIEGLGLILLFRWLPNRRLRAAAIIVLCAAFVRLTFNPAVFSYHPRSHTPIWNWYLYAYGVAGLCLLASAHWFGGIREKFYEKSGPPLLYVLSGIIFFLLLNIEIADYFSIGPTLTFSFAGNFARDMAYTISWSLFAFALLIAGMLKRIRPLRFAAVALLGLAIAKLFLHDLNSLNQLYRIAAFISVAVIAIIASFAYQRFLSPVVKE